MAEFFETAPLYGPRMLRSDRALVPAAGGIYAWFFREIPPVVPLKGCFEREGVALLYLGISPANPTSTSNIRKRVNSQHLGNQAGSSTLRRTLGVLLADLSGFPICVKENGKQSLTKPGEAWLNGWLDRNAMVCWAAHPEPWKEELRLLKLFSLPLNIDDNAHHPFAASLSRLRSDAARNAKLVIE